VPNARCVLAPESAAPRRAGDRQLARLSQTLRSDERAAEEVSSA